jgi:Holliday junction resolvase RusA-like endonuclease
VGEQTRVRVYDPPKAARWKVLTKLYLSKVYEGEPLEGPLVLSVFFFLPRPKSGWVSTQSRRNRALPHAKRPDIDNLVKSLKDACTGVLWKDDSQVFSMKVEKLYTPHGETPRVSLKIKEEPPNMGRNYGE